MTATRIRRTPVAAHHARPRPRFVAPVAAIAGGLTLLIRLALHTGSFDLFGDEVIYTDLGRSVINGGFPQFGGPFFLHPPGFFYLEAGWGRLLGSQHSLMGWIYEMRTLNALLAAATAVVLVLLAARAGSLWAGAAAGLLFALDPFCIRQNDRVLLETATMFWVMLGYLVFTSLIGRPALRRAWLRAVGAGLLFGCAVLTKDEAALLTVLPLLAAAALGWGPRRALIFLTICSTAAAYAAYVVVVAANGQLSALWEAKTSGIQRMLGVVQTSGFNSQGGGSLPGRLLAEVGYFGTTYVLLVLAVPAWVVVMRRGGQLQRMLGLLYCAAGVTLAYAVVLGTLEEQELYLLIIPSLLIVPVAATLVLQARPARRRSAPRGKATIAAVTVLVLAVGINLVTCVQWLRQPDDGWAQLFRYMGTHVPAGAQIGATSDDISALYALADTYQVEVLSPTDTDQVATSSDPARQSPEHPRYIVMEWSQVTEGYSNFTPSQARELVSRGQAVFSFQGRTYGDLVLYLMPLPQDHVHAGQSARRAPRRRPGTEALHRT